MMIKMLVISSFSLRQKFGEHFCCVNQCLLLSWPWDLLVLGKSGPPAHADLSASLAAVLQHLTLRSYHRTIYIQ